jgi:hypothetical protein
MGYFSLAFASAFLYAFWALGLGVYRGRLSNWLIILISAAGGTATCEVPCQHGSRAPCVAWRVPYQQA